MAKVMIDEADLKKARKLAKELDDILDEQDPQRRSAAVSKARELTRHIRDNV